MTLRILAVLALMCSCIGAAQADADNDRIAAERDAANARLSDQETRCNEQFVVSPCLEAARTAHRKTLHRLRLDELEVESKRRQVAADARRKQIAERALAQQPRASAADPAPPDARIHPVPRRALGPALRPPALGTPHPAGQPASGVSRFEQERLNTEAFEARTRAGEAHRAAVEARNAERAAHGQTAAPLPAPSSAR